MGLKEFLRAISDARAYITGMGIVITILIGAIRMLFGHDPLPDAIRQFLEGLTGKPPIKEPFRRCPGGTAVVVKPITEGYEVTVTFPFNGQNPKTVEGYWRAIASDSIRSRFNRDIADATIIGLRQSLVAESYDVFYRFADSLSQQYVRTSYLGEMVSSTEITNDSCYQVKVSANIANSNYGAGAMALKTAFRLEAKLNQNTFVNGDDIIISLSASENCYVAVFNLQSSGDSLQVLAPTQKMPRANISVGDKYQLPPPQSLFPLGVFLRKGQLYDKRLIFVIAAKGQSLPLPSEYASAALLPADGAMKAIKEWLAGLDAHNVAIAAVRYEIITPEPNP